MKCVSYTRSISSDSGDLTITEQNRLISDYVKKKGIAISAKYSDRKHDQKTDEAFYCMKQDGISRKYECVAFASLNCFGNNFFCAHDLLSRVFVPAGIYFISVSDDFCSFEHSTEEIEQYLQGKKRFYIQNAHPLSGQYSAGVRKTEKTVFGYLRVKGENQLVIDPVAEPIVKEIFRLALEGMTYSKISSKLNNDGVMSNACRLDQIYGRKENPNGYKWSNHSILKILNEQAYSGIWVTSMDGETVEIPCPAYITKEEQERIKLTAKRKKSTQSRVENVLKDLVFDKDTGENIRAQYSDKIDGRVYRFFRKQKSELKQKTEAISLAELNEMVIARIKQEKQEAQKASEFLNSQKGKECVKETLKSLREPARKKFEELVSVVRMISVTENNPSMDDLKLMKRADEIDAELETLSEEYEPKRKIFSLNNPWIERYVFFDQKEFSSKKEAAQFIQQILFDRYGECEIKMRLQEYKTPLMSLIER